MKLVGSFDPFDANRKGPKRAVGPILAACAVLVLGSDARAATRTWVGSAVAASADAEAERVLCPDGSVALGGGLDPANVLTMRLTSNAPAFGPENADRLMNSPNGTRPAPTAWQSSARNDEAFAQSFKVAAICSDDTTVTTEVAASFVDTGTSATLRVLCPEGSVAIGGGVDTGNIYVVSVAAQGPVFGAGPGNTLAGLAIGTGPAPLGWEATVRNDLGVDQAFKVAAICSTELTAVTQIGSFPLPVGSFGGTRLQCPEGMIATGGGMLPADPSAAFETADAPAFGVEQFDRLFTQSVGETEAPVGWQGNIVNEDDSVSSARLGVVCVPEPGALASAIAAAAALAWARKRA